MIQQILFVFTLILFSALITKRLQFIKRNILLGRAHKVEGDSGRRWKNVLLIAFGQKKMFANPLVAVMHFIIYAGFFIINIEVLEIVIDGIFGTHRVLYKPLGSNYSLLINSFELLAVSVLLACVVFLARRNVLKLKRFWSAEMTTWPRTDANIILVVEIFLMSAFLTMNAADYQLQLKGHEHYVQTGAFWFSGALSSIFSGLSVSALVGIERSMWWLHIIGILAFALYVTYSKHLHIFMAFPNTYYGRLEPAGKIENMESIQNEVRIALGLEADPNAAPPEKFGAKDVTDLSWKHLMDAYSCTQCGRCTAACPANQTGKLLSPRKIMMDTRRRADEVGMLIDQKNEDKISENPLLGNYISREELLACTSCNACVEACPVSINPLDIIIELRRNMIMEEAHAPASWNAMFNNLENNGAPWSFSPSDRANWIAQAAS
jgi:heterodisulfide reductase subunit C